MKKKILLTLASLVGVFVISLPITRYRLEEKVNPVSITTSVNELDSYLANSESKLGNIVEGAEKKIFWANGKQEHNTLLYTSTDIVPLDLRCFLFPT